MFQASDMAGFPRKGSDAIVSEADGSTTVIGTLRIKGAGWNPGSYSSAAKVLTITGQSNDQELFHIRNSGNVFILSTLDVGGITCTNGTVGTSGATGSALRGKDAFTFDGVNSNYLGYYNVQLCVFDGTASYPAQFSVTLTAATLAVPLHLPAYTVMTLPAATAAGVIYVSDETGGPVLAFSDGTNWRRVTDRAVIS